MGQKKIQVIQIIYTCDLCNKDMHLHEQRKCILCKKDICEGCTSLKAQYQVKYLEVLYLVDPYKRDLDICKECVKDMPLFAALKEKVIESIKKYEAEKK